MVIPSAPLAVMPLTPLIVTAFGVIETTVPSAPVALIPSAPLTVKVPSAPLAVMPSAGLMGRGLAPPAGDPVGAVPNSLSRALAGVSRRVSFGLLWLVDGGALQRPRAGRGP